VRVFWIALLKSAGLPEKVRMHYLRHTFATLMLDHGEDLIAVQRTLGHSRSTITADLYVGRVPSAQKRAVERYGELLQTRTANRGR
jgi:integrase